MSKKLSLISTALFHCFLLIGCARKVDSIENRTNDVSEQEEITISQELEDNTISQELEDVLLSNPEPVVEINTNADSGVDVDLTVLSSTMVYAEVYNIMVFPEKYIGKTVKMRGKYYASYYDETGKYYHYVIIEDAAECCQQGLEFIWNGDHTYTDDYPADGTEVEVVGTFGNYEELDVSYTYISTDEINIIE